ncbi:TetR/AcrR family transcriptional regulator [Thalassovita taeanensis]|uniref:Transcriptional regulator, TetR family n=1 Tax=Thalassovita taeanensis TaxID=657014 RepID=A0A1H9C9C5_9RHOB|nr:TetR/AcrR family transcriptional regulator [Thalassovita taeanensis]SEP97288.1 transcriptional regulator, TetR family [Thalassovita taeanensis]
MSAKTPHHHGNLRPALIAAGITVLEEDGMAGLSLRKVAAKVGVSHAAPAHHFNGKNGLLLGIAAEGFRTFVKLMQEGRDTAAPDPQAQLLGLCHGYLKFADEHQALFQLIFSTEIKNDPDEDLRKVSLQAFDMLVDTCALFEPSPQHERANEVMIWSLVHGYATLRRFNRMMASERNVVMPFDLILPKMTPKAPPG